MPVGIVFPLSFLISTPENFAITASLKFSLISVGETSLEISAAGLTEFSLGWASAELATRLIAKTARVPIAIVFRDIPIPFLVLKPQSRIARGLDWGAKPPQSGTDF